MLVVALTIMILPVSGFISGVNCPFGGVTALSDALVSLLTGGDSFSSRLSSEQPSRLTLFSPNEFFSTSPSSSFGVACTKKMRRGRKKSGYQRFLFCFSPQGIQG